MSTSALRIGIEELEARLLYSADAALLLTGVPVAEVRRIDAGPAVPAATADSGARWLLVDRRAEDWDALLAQAQAADPARPVQLRWIEPTEAGEAVRAALAEASTAPPLVAAWVDAEGRAWLGGSTLEASPATGLASEPQAAPSAVVSGPAEDWTLEPRRELVIIDGRVEGAGALAALWWADADATRQLEVIVTDPARDGLTQVGELLAARGELSAVHLVGHGTAGQFSFGGGAIDANTLGRQAEALRGWGRALAPGGDLLLYGCDTGAGEAGAALLDALQALTGADVAASTDATGGLGTGGDWLLEATRGTVETALSAPATAALQRWEGRLAAYTVTDFSDNLFSPFTLRAAITSANASAGADTITFLNFGMPVTITLFSTLPAITDTVTIDGSSGGAPSVAISGSLLGANSDGLRLQAGATGSTIRGLAIENFSRDGIVLSGSGGHLIAGNWIGLNLFLGNAAGNDGAGIRIESSGNTIGGTTAADRNIVSGNRTGILLTGASASANQVSGNWIGLSTAGSSTVANLEDGVRLENGATGNTVGGTAGSGGNVISGNGRDGVRIDGETTDGNTVNGNWIGTNAAGTASLGQGGHGIRVQGGADSTRIGGVATGAGNWIASPGLAGIAVDGASTGTTIQGNRIGTDQAGSANWGAQQNGIRLENGAAQSSLLDNTVAHSGRGGVLTAGIGVAASAGSGNLLSRNLISSSAGLGIDVGATGLDTNDALDADAGANDLQNHPLLSGATLGNGTIRLTGQLGSAASALYRIEFFADASGGGAAKVYLGQTSVTTDAAGSATIDAMIQASLVAGTTITATATRVSSGSTSELSPAVVVAAAAAVNTPSGFDAASGQVVTPVGGQDDEAAAMVLQQDGRLLVAGHQRIGGSDEVLLMRHLADGQLDTSFGSGGIVTVLASSFGGSNARLLTMAVQSDGCIVVAGRVTVGVDTYALVQRYLADGSLDTSFSGDGTALWGAGGVSCEAGAMAIDAQGRILLGGTLNGMFAVARLLADGSLDASFGGGDGYDWIDAGPGTDQVHALVLQSDGGLLVGGSSGSDYALLRWTASGALDAVFGSGGKVVGDLAGGTDAIRALCVLDDGRILAAGDAGGSGGASDLLVMRLLADGSLDASFAGTGRATHSLGGADSARAIGIDASDRIVLAGQSGSGQVALVRLLADGSLDAAFGQNGAVQPAVGSGSAASAVVLRPDGRLVAAGWSSDGTQRDPLLLGLLADGSLDPGFGTAVSTLGGTVAWTEGAAAVTLDGDVRLHDADLASSGSYAGAVLTLARQGGAQAEDLLGFDGVVVTTSGADVSVSGVVVGSWAFSGGQLQVTFGAAATQDRVDTLARHIVYASSTDAPPASVTIDWLLSDGTTPGQGSVSVAIAAVNDAPAGTSRTITLTDTATHTFSAADFGYSDPEGDALQSVTLVTLPGSGVLMLAGQKVSAGQVIVAADLARLVYLPTGQVGDVSPTFTFQVRDSGGALDPSADTITLAVSAVDSAPLLALGATNLVQNGSFSTDGSGWSGNSGVEAVGAGKAVEFGVPPSPSGDGFVEVEGGAFLGSTPAWLEQTITTTAGQRYVFSLQAVTRNQFNTGDMGALSVDGVELLRFTAGSDWSRHAVEFTATGGTATIRITSLGSIATNTWIGTAPGDTIGLLVDDVCVQAVAGQAAWTEGNPPVVLAPGVLPIDAELDAGDDWGGASLTLARQGGMVASDLFGASGTLGALTSGGALTLGGVTVGSVVTQGGGQLVLSFATGTSADQVRDVLRQITYASSSESPDATVTLDWTLSDGNTGAQGGGGLATFTASMTLAVTGVNDAPTLASAISDPTATQDQPFSFQLPAGTFADADAGDALTCSTSPLPAWLSFDAATRTFSGTPAHGDVGSVTITVTATDGSGAQVSDTFVLTVANVNDAPTL
ncbi:MAG: hypothetical protein RL223_2665, partial [Pseudomonadota bacterium]